MLNYDHSDPKVVLCFGDSNTWGYMPACGDRYPYPVRWTTVLGDLLGPGYRTENEGVSGRTTAFDRVGFPWKNGAAYLAPCISTHRPVDTLIVMLGTNDCLLELSLSDAELELGMEKVITAADTALMELQGVLPTRVLVAPAAMLPDMKGTPFDYQADEISVARSRKLGAIYGRLAQKHGWLFVDGTDAFEVSSADHMHLTEKGHRQLAETLFKLIRPRGTER